MEQESGGVARANIDLTLTEAEVNDDLANISYVTRVLAADSANLNDVQKVRVMLHNSATKVPLNHYSFVEFLVLFILFAINHQIFK